MKKLTYAVLAILAASAFLFYQTNTYFSEQQKAGQLKAYLTIYVAAPLLDNGGTVIVISNPISVEQWKALPRGENATDTDPLNAKREALKKGDRLFGVVASTNTSIIEFVYPEGGTFGFNFVAMNTPGKEPRALRTQEILVGDGGYTDRSTGQNIVWEYVSTIHVFGPKTSEDNSRAARVFSSEIMNLHPRKTLYEGANLYSPTDEQVEKAVLTPQELK